MLHENQSFVIPKKTYEEISFFLKENRIKFCELAKKMNLTPLYVSQVCRGKRPLSKKNYEKMKQVLGINTE